VDAVHFEFPSPAIPFVVTSGQVAGVEAPLRVLFDTGNAAPFVVVVGERSAAAAQAKRTGAPPVVFHGVAGGSPAEIAPARLAEFRLGPITLHDVSAGLSSAVDKVGAQIPGGLDLVVGQEFARGRVVSFDYPHRQIDFSGRVGAPAAAMTMTLAPKRPLIVVDAKVNGHGPYRMVLDTGASATLLSPTAAKDAGVGESGPTMALGGAGGTQSRGRIETAGVEVGPNHFPPGLVVVADLLDAVSEEAGTQVDGVLGASLLTRGTLTLDYPGHRLWIDIPPRETSP
jgi:hypothetical protein